MRISHVSLTARNVEGLAAFYVNTFGFVVKRELRSFSGVKYSRGNGLNGISISSIWLHLPEHPMPFLEIMSYSQSTDRGTPAVNDPGFGHLALLVKNLEESCADVLSCGGSMQGDVTNLGSEGAPILVVYVRDPEGNVIELEQDAFC